MLRETDWKFGPAFVASMGMMLALASAAEPARAQDVPANVDTAADTAVEPEESASTEDEGDDSAAAEGATDPAAAPAAAEEAAAEELAAEEAAAELAAAAEEAAAFEEASSELATELDHRAPLSPEGVSTPGDATGDWIQINSGEWLRGEITILRDEVLEFDSEEMDDVSFDWGDIVALRSPHTNRYVQNYDDVFAGPAIIDKESVTVETDEGTVIFPRSELTAILGGEDTEASRWSAFMGLGFDGNWGASEQISMSANAWIAREDASTRVKLSYDAAWGQSNDTVNVNNMWGRFRFDLFISDVFYVTPLSGPAGYDKFLGLEFRTAPGSGVGVHAIDRPNMDWDFDVALAYVFTNFLKPPTGEVNIEHDAGIRLATFYSWDLTSDIEFDANHETLLVVTNLDLTQFTTQGTLSIDLTGDLDLDLMFRHTRIKGPEPIDDGTGMLIERDQDQFQLTIGLGWDI